MFSRIRALLKKNTGETMIVEREQFAKEMKEKFKGNIELLKAIEECMNRKVKRHEYVSLMD
jgi:hypothetical protein